MYEIVETVRKIKEEAKKKGIKISDMLISCDLNINTLSSMSNRGSWIQSNSLAKIADYLNCSVDYLLGRTDNPNIQPNTINSNNNISNIGNGTQTAVIGSNSPIMDEMGTELLNRFNNMSFADKMDIMNYVLNKNKGE